jgi:hypothetical protein
MRPVRLVLVLLVALLALLPGALVKPDVEPAAAASGSIKVALEGRPSWLDVPRVLEDFGPPDINDAGSVAFYAQESGGQCAVLRGDLLMPAPPRPMAADGDPSPIGPPSLYHALNESVIINAAGQVAFSASGNTTVCPSPPCKGIFSGTRAGAHTRVAYEGMPEPGDGA